MAAPLSGIGSQSIPLSQPYQTGGSDQSREVRQQSQEPKENAIQARNAATAQSQDSNAKKSDDHFAKHLNTEQQSQAQNQSKERGSVVDLIV